MSLSGSVNLGGFYVSHSASPGVAEFKSYQYTLLTRGEDIRRQPGVTISDVLNNTPNTCSFTVDGGAPVPQVGEKIEIHDEQDANRRLFAGTVQSVEQIYEGQIDQIAWRVQCIDFTWLLNRRRPFGQWVNTSVSIVVKDLLSRYCPGFTALHVQTNLAKVTVTLDGSQDMVTVLNNLAAAIGGGHWYVDYDQDVHFFHVVPPGLEVPIGPPPVSFAHMTVTQGGGIAQTFEFGYYIFRHSFVYSDGSESQLQAITTPLKCSGANQLVFSGLPTGTNLGSLTCVARRIYYNKFIIGFPGGEPIEKIRDFCQVNDNTTTGFTTNFGSLGASVSTVADISSTLPGQSGPTTAPSVVLGALWSQSPIPSSHSPYNFYPFTFAYTFIFDDGRESASSPVTVFQDADSTHGWTATITTGGANVVKRRLYLSVAGGGSRWLEISDNTTTVVSNTSNGVNGDPQALYTNVNWLLLGAALGGIGTTGSGSPPDGTNGTKKLAFQGHLPGPATAPVGQVDTVSGPGYWTGISVQFKYAYLYRDGSITFPSPASATIIKHLIKGQGIAGYQLNSVTIGPTIEGNEVVARLVYFASAGLANPNLSIPGNFPDGFEWPSPFLEPNWAGGSVGGIAILPDNATTTLANFQLGDLDRAFGSYTGAVCGRGNVPYDNGSGAVLSVDPIPIWPNPDGPFLEDVDPPNDIDDANEDLLHEDSGSQPFSMTTDLSQIRNKVMVIGSGSILTASGAIGDSAVYVADVAAFSPSGGTVKYDDPGTGAVVKIRYTGVQGVPGNAAITLASSLTQVIPQGTNIANYFEAEDHESQLFLSKIELDKDGHTTDGVHEYTIVDTSLKATFQLFMRAYAELELFSKPIVSIRYATRDPKSRSGQSVHVDLTSPPCVGDFLIQQVQIDQIHDESDQLLPRYTVTASSSKFDLNDLLLKIIGGDLNSHGGGSSAGIVAAGVAQSTAAATVGLPNPAMWPNGRKWTLVTYHVNGASDALSSGLSSGWNSSGSTANQNDVYPGTGGVMSNWVRYLPVNNNGNLCGIASSGGNFWEMHPKGIFRFRTGSKLNNMAAGGNHRAYWFGLFTAAPANGGVVTVTAPHVSLLCFDPGDGGGSFEISSTVSGTGSTQVRSNLGFAPMLPNTHYRVTVTSSDTSATILVEDLTRNLNYTASVNIAAYHSTEMIAATKNFLGVMYGSATIMSPEVTVGAGGLDIGAGYLEVD